MIIYLFNSLVFALKIF